MKIKKICFLTLLLAAFFVTACESEKVSVKNIDSRNNTVDKVLSEKIAEAENTAADDESEPSDEASVRQSGVAADAPLPEKNDDQNLKLSNTEGIDVDLTSLSSTMVYSEVYNMMSMPENYVGKTIKMNGALSIFYDDNLDKYYFACIVQDATACCAQGIEFEASEDYKYPDDFPEDGENITVIGVFDTYEEDGYKFATLRNAEIS